MNIFGRNKKQRSTPKELEKKIKALEEQTEKLSKDLEAFQKNMQQAIQKVGMVRFNPFDEVGGDQSFSVALLDNGDTGFVITSHYGKDSNRIYAKSVQGGVSSYSLSEEEQEAIKKAISRENDN